MPKYYVMLVDSAKQQMRVPVKAALNPYNGKPAYCGGMPQFFGGTAAKDESPADSLKKEVGEESRRTLALTTDSPVPLFADMDQDMYFYRAGRDGWQPTGTAWGDAQDEAEAEMSRIVSVDLTLFDEDWSDDALINELILQTGSQSASAKAQQQFAESETRKAFIELLRLLLED